MKHKIVSHVPINRRESIFTIELLPETRVELEAIRQAENMKPNEMVENYLNFCLGDKYSIEGGDFLGNAKFRAVAFDNEVD